MKLSLKEKSILLPESSEYIVKLPNIYNCVITVTVVNPIHFP